MPQQINKPLKLNMDKDYKYLDDDEFFYGLNHKSALILNGKKTNSKKGKNTQFAANYSACEFVVPPTGESYTIGTFYAQQTNEEYSCHWNSAGMNFIQRISETGCDIVYSGPCLKFSPERRHAVTQFRADLYVVPDCKNRHGKYLIISDGINNYFIDVEASINTNYFSTPFFQKCANPCDMVNLCVPSPNIVPIGGFVPITMAERSLTNFLLDKSMQFAFRWVYYDRLRASTWSKFSPTFFQNTLGRNAAPADLARKMKFRIPVGGPQVDLIEIAVSFDGGFSWEIAGQVEKYQQYNSSQQFWYERQLAPLENYSDTDCSFDWYYDGSIQGAKVSPEDINRNYDDHPRQAQGIIRIGNSFAYYNYVKGSCPLDKLQTDKFKLRLIPSLADNGLKAGGSYEFKFILNGNCGFYAEAHGSQIMNMPRSQEKGVYSFHDFFYDFTGMLLPLQCTSLSIVRTKNQNPFVMQWKIIAIKRENGKLKLAFQNLNDYNEKKNFATNIIYQHVNGDQLEFIRKGGGAGFFSTAQYGGILSYKIENPYTDTSISNPNPRPGNFFNQIIIKEDSRLAAIPDSELIGCIIEVQRPRKVQNPAFYEVCTLKVENGRVVVPTGTFHTFDTFLIYRETVDASIPFEHFCPNDLWPSLNHTPLEDVGRIWVANKFSKERRYERYLTLNSEGAFNRFGDREKKLPDDVQGGIVGMKVYDNKVGLAICENDNFLIGVNDNFLRVNEQGVVTVTPPDGIISDPEAKISGKYGCQYEDVQGICFGDGWVTWDDTGSLTHVKHDFGSAVNAAKDKVESYFSRKLQEMKAYNATVSDPLSQLRIITGYNPSEGILMHTVKALRDSGTNNSYAAFERSNETLLYSPETGDYFGFVMFTPEAYGFVSLNTKEGCQFISYLNSTPYIHPALSDKANEFYGVPGDTVVSISVNMEKSKQKRGLSIEYQSDARPMVYSLTTDRDTGFISEIPAKKWESRNKGKWNASFLYNKNSPGGLHGANGRQEAIGYVFNIVFVRDNTNNLAYGTIDNSKRTKYSESDGIITKFVFIEQSGVTTK